MLMKNALLVIFLVFSLAWTTSGIETNSNCNLNLESDSVAGAPFKSFDKRVINFIKNSDKQTLLLLENNLEKTLLSMLSQRESHDSLCQTTLRTCKKKYRHESCATLSQIIYKQAEFKIKSKKDELSDSNLLLKNLKKVSFNNREDCLRHMNLFNKSSENMEKDSHIISLLAKLISFRQKALKDEIAAEKKKAEAKKRRIEKKKKNGEKLTEEEREIIAVQISSLAQKLNSKEATSMMQINENSFVAKAKDFSNKLTSNLGEVVKKYVRYDVNFMSLLQVQQNKDVSPSQAIYVQIKSKLGKFKSLAEEEDFLKKSLQQVLLIKGTFAKSRKDLNLAYELASKNCKERVDIYEQKIKKLEDFIIDIRIELDQAKRNLKFLRDKGSLCKMTNENKRICNDIAAFCRSYEINSNEEIFELKDASDNVRTFIKGQKEEKEE